MAGSAEGSAGLGDRLPIRSTNFQSVRLTLFRPARTSSSVKVTVSLAVGYQASDMSKTQLLELDTGDAADDRGQTSTPHETAGAAHRFDDVIQKCVCNTHHVCWLYSVLYWRYRARTLKFSGNWTDFPGKVTGDSEDESKGK